MVATPILPGLKPVPESGADCRTLGDAADASWVKRIAERLNRVMSGKLYATFAMTLAANAATTTVTDARISGMSTFFLQPTTAHAAAALVASPYVLVTALTTGSVTFTHANDALTDKTFNVLVIG